MGAQSTDQGLLDIRFGQYLFQIRVISQSEVGLEIIDIKTFQTYSLESHQFVTQINTSTLIAALNRKEENHLKLSISVGLTSEKEHFLKIVLNVTYDFIPDFSEILIVPLKKGVSEKEMIQTQLKLINSEISYLQKSIEGHNHQSCTKYVATSSSGTFNGANHIITKLELPRGKYEINLQFYTQSTQNWIYLKLNNSQTGIDCLKLPEGGYYFTLANSSYYQPHIIRSFVEITNDQATLQLESQACNSYPWNMKNLVLSATSI
ncbi:hypothetical protein ABPG72_010855 [Tetrahymena utriculariae]